MDLDLISKFFIFPVLIIALVTAKISGPMIGIQVPKHRYSSIDGLRGFLSIFVFLHHSAIWYYFSHIHKWSRVPSTLFNHFGSTSVAFFFMITAFLFFTKLINAFSSEFDWTKLYVSRILRIMPLYTVTVFILAFMIGLISHFRLMEPFQNLLIHLLQWTFFMEPEINKIHGTRYILSGVQWSLAYEWAFYCSLAGIGFLFFRIKTPLVTIFFTVLFAIIFVIIIDKYYYTWERMTPFLSGLLAAFLVKNQTIKRFSSKHFVTPVLIILLCVALFYYPNVFEPVPYLCTTIVFIAIASGNTFFGILTCRPSLILGQISYSIYLLHGFILFIAFYFVVGFNHAEKLPILLYWIIIFICAIALVLICSFTYYFLEKPGIDSAGNITTKVKRFFKKSIHPLQS